MTDFLQQTTGKRKVDPSQSENSAITDTFFCRTTISVVCHRSIIPKSSYSSGHFTRTIRNLENFFQNDTPWRGRVVGLGAGE